MNAPALTLNPLVASDLEAEVHIRAPYKVYFREHLFSPSNVFFRDCFKTYETPLSVFIDGGLKNTQHFNAIHQYFSTHFSGKKFHLHLLPGGENCKQLKSLENVLQHFIKDDLCKRSHIIAIGGGAFLDLIGFAAATFHRGMPFWRVPTTSLSQCDSGVGIKNGINLGRLKNALGTHAIPQGVFIDPDFLSSLDIRSWTAGIGECVKIALLKSPNYFNEIQEHSTAFQERSPDISNSVLKQCAIFHFQHIATSNDPYENHESRPLDFGHWSAHKIESLTEYQIQHGEAVLAGLSIDCTYSHLQNWLCKETFSRICSLNNKLLSDKATRQYIKNLRPERIFEGIEEFRQHIGGKLCLTMLKDIGCPMEVDHVDQKIMLRSIVDFQLTL